MPSQTEAGKAFEYALLKQSFEFLADNHNVNINEDSSFQIAKNCFSLLNKVEQKKYLKAASAAIKHIVELEPRLVNPTSSEDTLTLQIIADAEGIKGDVRDVILFVQHKIGKLEFQQKIITKLLNILDYLIKLILVKNG